MQNKTNINRGASKSPSLSLLLSMLVAAVGGMSTPALLAGQFDVDQQNLVSISAGWSAVYMAPMGQEFVPGRHSLNAVELVLANRDTFSTFPGRVQVNIRDGGILGPILGASLPLDLPFGYYDIAHFVFPSSVRLTPGRMHVIEIVVFPGGGNVCVAGGYGSYARGRAIIQGVPVPPTAADDLWFREGTQRGGKY